MAPWPSPRSALAEINDELPFKATRRDAIANVKSFGASNLSCRQTQCRFI